VAETEAKSLYRRPAQGHFLTCLPVLIEHCRGVELPVSEFHTQLVTPHRGQSHFYSELKEPYSTSRADTCSTARRLHWWTDGFLWSGKGRSMRLIDTLGNGEGGEPPALVGANPWTKLKRRDLVLLGPHLLPRLRNSLSTTTDTSPKLYLHCTSMDVEGEGVYSAKVRRGRWRLPEA